MSRSASAVRPRGLNAVEQLHLDHAMQAARAKAGLPSAARLRLRSVARRKSRDARASTKPFSRSAGKTDSQPGPIGEYIEVVDVDPASQCCYAPVDLNDPYILTQIGLTPSEASPQFHQQMAYAVAMKTIEHFERALGRVALWAPREDPQVDGKETTTEYVAAAAHLSARAARQERLLQPGPQGAAARLFHRLGRPAPRG